MTLLLKITLQAYRSWNSVFILVICLLFLTGCKVELYSQLSEKQANAMLSALIHGGVRTTKASMGKGLFQIRVEESDLARSITILDAKGLPGDEFATMGDLYKKEGLISSPMEERVRYMFALSQSIAETLTNIDGVLVARVHVALPESDKYSGDFRPTSASVFIKHHHKYSQDRAIPEIKRIVESSIEGLSYERIAVFMSSSEIGKSMNADGHSRGYASLDGSSGIFSSRKLILIMYASTTFLLMCTIGWLALKLGTTGLIPNRKMLGIIKNKYKRTCQRLGINPIKNSVKGNSNQTRSDTR